ncbi:MAG: hypothetical protein ACRBK7_03155 [Acidimicrobiales bacterium]
MATQLRRYEIAEGQMDRFVAWFPSIVEARAKYGFTLDSAVADRENNEFVWVTSHPGDYEAVLEVYNVSPERAAVFEGWDSPVEKLHVSWVEPLNI